MKKKKIIAIVLLAVLILPFFSPAADAAYDLNNGWNIMLVVDGSGSLYSRTNGQAPTDPDGMRYEAIDSILGLVPNGGNWNVGAIVFDANPTNNASDENMRRCVMLNTDLKPLSDSTDRSWLSDRIRMVRSRNSGGATDFCTALLVAQEMLASANNGKPSAIFLLTDGKLALNGGNTAQQAIANGQRAVQAISATLSDNDPSNDILLCGVFLNKDGKVVSTQLRDLVRDSLGNLPTSSPLSEHYVELQSADDMNTATRKFATLLGIIRNRNPLSDLDYDFLIPGVGVSEAQIYIEAEEGYRLPDGMQVKITRPDGTVMTTSEMSGISWATSITQNYRLLNPESGLWKVNTILPEGSKVSVYHEVIMIYNIDAEMEVTPATGLHVNSDVTINAFLSKDGVRLTDPLDYREYDCEALFTDLMTGEEFTMDIPQVSAGVYQLQTRLDRYTSLQAQVAFYCGEKKEIYVVSDPVVWDLSNNPPTCYGTVSKSISFGLFGSGEATFDLSDPEYGIADLEDPVEDLKLRLGTVKTDRSGGVQMTADGLVTVNGKQSGSGRVEVEILDTQGASAILTIRLFVKDRTRTDIILAVIAGLVVIAAVLAAIIFWGKGVTEGNLSVKFEFRDNSETKTVTVKGLNPPGSPTTGAGSRKTDLMKILSVTGLDSATVSRACADSGVDANAFKSVVQQQSGALRSVKLCSHQTVDSEGIKNRNKISVHYNKEKEIIVPGESTSKITPGDGNDGFSVQISYYIINKNINGGHGGKNIFLNNNKNNNPANDGRRNLFLNNNRDKDNNKPGNDGRDTANGPSSENRNRTIFRRPKS